MTERSRLSLRVTQFVQALSTPESSEVDRRLHMLLGDERQWFLLERLSTYDRLHHLRVYQRLRNMQQTDADLLRAGLLHDVGKADACGRVRLWHRVLRVIGRTIAPGLMTRYGAKARRGIGHGIWLAERHAHLGAQLAREAGVSERCCELIARHEDHCAAGDQQLLALMQADEGSLA